jgi:hypothetical protein
MKLSNVEGAEAVDCSWRSAEATVLRVTSATTKIGRKFTSGRLSEKAGGS